MLADGALFLELEPEVTARASLEQQTRHPNILLLASRRYHYSKLRLVVSLSLIPVGLIPMLFCIKTIRFNTMYNLNYNFTCIGWRNGVTSHLGPESLGWLGTEKIEGVSRRIFNPGSGKTDRTQFLRQWSKGATHSK